MSEMPNLETIRALEPQIQPEQEVRVVWTPDLVDNEGDPECEHNWINGKDFIQTDKNGIPITERILPRICSKCERKEYLFEHTEVQELKEVLYTTINKSLSSKLIKIKS